MRTLHEYSCRVITNHIRIQRGVIADYFEITVNALNARLRTCTDRLYSYPDFVTLGIRLLEAVKEVRSDLDGFVHPIWKLSRRLLQSYRNELLDEELDGVRERKGVLFDFLATSNFEIDGLMPQAKPTDESTRLNRTDRKRKHSGEILAPSRSSSPVDDKVLSNERSRVSTNSETGHLPKKSKISETDQNSIEISEEDSTGECKNSSAVTAKVSGKGSRSDPYSSHELCTIYIARKIRALDWDTISWALSRFKTPTIAVLSEARTAFDPHHDLILDTMKLCCWPENSMYLIACAASECLSAMERGNWSDEIREFKNNKGELYHIYMQRRLERIFRKTLETPEQKRQRRRRERMVGYESLSIQDYGRLPHKKRENAQISVGRVSSGRKKRRTKEEMQQAAEEKAAARALLKANGLKANGEAMSDRRKTVQQLDQKAATAAIEMPPSFADVEMKEQMEKGKSSRPKKAPRRKYDIPDVDRIAFAGDALKVRRIKYDLRPEDELIARRHDGISVVRTTQSKPSPLRNVTILPAHNSPPEHSTRHPSDRCTQLRAHIENGAKPQDSVVSRFTDDGQEERNNQMYKYRDSDSFIKVNESPRQTIAYTSFERGQPPITPQRDPINPLKSPMKQISITSLLDGPPRRSPGFQVDHFGAETHKNTSKPGFQGTSNYSTPQDKPKSTKTTPEEKSRSSMSLAALLN